jgi:hypothetical protein
MLLAFFLSFLAPLETVLAEQEMTEEGAMFESRIQVWLYTLDGHKFQLDLLHIV